MFFVVDVTIYISLKPKHTCLLSVMDFMRKPNAKVE